MTNKLDYNARLQRWSEPMPQPKSAYLRSVLSERGSGHNCSSELTEHQRTLTLGWQCGVGDKEGTEATGGGVGKWDTVVD